MIRSFHCPDVIWEAATKVAAKLEITLGFFVRMAIVNTIKKETGKEITAVLKRGRPRLNSKGR